MLSVKDSERPMKLELFPSSHFLWVGPEVLRQRLLYLPTSQNKNFASRWESSVLLTDILFLFPSEKKRKLETVRGHKQQKKFKKTKDVKQKRKK